MALRTIKRLGALAGFLIAAVLAGHATAATLYITEFPAGVSPAGTQTAQMPGQPAVTTQAIALSGASALSAAFNAKTHAVLLTCDEGCSVVFGTGPTATTSDTLLQQGVPYYFGVAPGDKVAVIANAAGDLPGGGGVSSDVNLADVGGAAVALGQAAMAASIPVVVASDQSTLPVSDAPSSSATVGVAPVVTAAAASSKVLKAGAGNLYSFSVTSGASAGVAYVFDATSLPANGAVTPVDCYVLAANQSIGVQYDPPMVMATGITIGFGTGTNCFSLTASATAFVSGLAK